MASETFLATLGLVGLRLLQLHGISPRRFVWELGIKTPRAGDVEARLPASLVDEGFAKALALIPDPAFTLRVAECWHPSNLGTMGYAWLSSHTLRTALRRLQRYAGILGQKARCTCVENADGVRFSYDPRRDNAAVSFALAELMLALILSMCRTNFGDSLVPVAVSLRRPEPENRAPYDAHFGVKVDFGAEIDSFSLSNTDADFQLPTSNMALARTFDSILAAQLSELSSKDLQSRCQAYLLEELTSGEPTEDGLAKALAMSKRTLQRKLGEQGLTYRSLLEQTRHDLALRYLGDPKKSVTTITFLLGFSEQSAFTRAFKRWTGKAPTAYREQLA